tara:strand:- start:74 stop:409 length:336 start_codon:yes stop_codon:yes gene_type:complete
MYEISGKVKVMMETQTFNSGFQKREFVITTAENYPQDVKLECVQDKVALLDSIQEGDQVKARFNIRGNEYQDRYFVNLQAWAIDKVSASGPEAPVANAESAPMPDEDDLPF